MKKIILRVLAPLIPLYLYWQSSGSLLKGMSCWWSELFGSKKIVTFNKGGKEISFRLGTSDIHVWYAIFKKGEYKLDYLKNPEWIIDAGAYGGYSAAWFAETYPNAKIVSVEPDEGNFEMLKRNTAFSSNVIHYNKALWSEPGTLTVYDRGSGSWGFTVVPQANSSLKVLAQIPATTLDQIIEEQSINTIDLLKLDIEGSEEAVLNNSDNWLPLVKGMAIELHDRISPGCTEAYNRAAASFDKKWSRGENHFAERA